MADVADVKRLRVLLAIALPFFLMPVAQRSVFAQNSTAVCDGSSVQRPASSTHTWPAPLDHVVTLKEGALPIAQALSRLTDVAQLRISFSTDLLPADRIVCMTWRNARVGDVIAAMLDGTDLEAVITGTGQVVVARSHAATSTSTNTNRVFELSPVQATADAERAAAQRSPTISMMVLDRSSAGWRPDGNLVDVLNSNVPGMWMWSSSASGIAANYGSTRGTSTFGVSAPKILIDGIEVANPLLLSHITMDAVERIEVIRGPQGSARYGADALNGVTNIITRHDTSAANSLALRVQLSSTIGSAATQYAATSALTQDHALRMQLGHTARSFDLNLGLASVGAYAPGSGTTRGNADASLRIVSPKSIVTGTLRYLSQVVDTSGAGNALTTLSHYALATAFANTSVTEALSLHEYTAGVNASYAQDSRWTHSLVAGLDGYTLDGVAWDSAAPASSTAGILRDAGTSGLRLTLRGNSTARIVSGATDMMLTFTADHTRISQTADNLPVYAPPPPLRADSLNHSGSGHSIRRENALYAGTVAGTDLRTSSGFSTEITTSMPNHVTLTGALRLERDAGASAGAGRTSALPLLGASYAVVSGDADINLRASYGKGVRWPAVAGLREHTQIMRASLEPEQQSGVEAGIDLHLRRAFALQLTWFDQSATGLAQQVTIAAPERGRGPGGPRFGVELQSVGAISNRGVELQGIVRHGTLSLASAATLVDSKVLRVAAGYTGDLRPGDRPLAVPAHTLSVSGAITHPTWSASANVFRAADWVNYDRIAMTLAQSKDSSAVNVRKFWKSYDGFTHVGINATHNLARGFVLTGGVSNLLDHQVGEPDNVTIVPGRTYQLGIRAIF